MDLTRFTKSKAETNNKKKIILDTEDIKITQNTDNQIEFFIKNRNALDKYQDFLFCSPTNSITANNKKEVEKFFKKSIEEGVEGVMLKNLDAPYKSGLRTGAMAKLKETKEDIDVVIVGAEYGKGKRAGFYSSFFVAVKNDEYFDESDQFLRIGKVSSGIKELGEEGHSMENLTNLLEPLKLHEEDSIVHFEPKVVLQVRYQEIQKSEIYESGYALRFPRIISLREDKPTDEINSIEDIQNFVSL